MTRTLPAVLLPAALAALLLAADPESDEGIRPVGADGQPLNLDFETGTLKDWTAQGEAFAGQPIRGDTVHPRRSDMKSEHQGQFWIGGFEKLGDRPEGTLTSVQFKVTHPWCSFLVGGGPNPSTRVELVRKDTGEVFSRTSGIEEENLKRVAVDLSTLVGKEIFIRLVDRHTGHWGHLNFDDFRFHTTKPNFPQRKGAEPLPPPDTYKYNGLSPEEAAKVMTVPPGFEVKLFAGEPDVKQPIAFCLDDRGRLWVAEAYTYPRRAPEGQGKDRILIFEDTDGDGHFDKRTVFMEGLNLVSGIEYGFGGLWVGAAPYLMFIPIKEERSPHAPREGLNHAERDGYVTKPAGEPKILLDGWHYEDTHETLNSFIWGPDGWLYGCHGVFTHSRVGKPGTPDKDRTPINAGVWRYHPIRHTFEVFAHGISNQWGLDFNDWGQAFCEACVIPHNWHVIQGARYQRQAGSHFNPYTFDDIKTIAEHRHYVGPNPHGGNNRSDSAGGGHAHCGTMIYLGGAWPAEYRNQMFMGNVHGRRLNVDKLTPKGSGYVAGRAPDFLLANDGWARFINMRYGPDGNVYLIDWYDKQACHLNQPEAFDRSNGRIYKVCYKGTKPVTGVDLSKATDAELWNHQLDKNDWYVRHARRILQERWQGNLSRREPGEGQVGEILAAAKGSQAKEEVQRLRMLWARHATQGPSLGMLEQASKDPSPYIRAWAIQLSLEDRQFPELFPRFVEMADRELSPIVRLYLASGLQRMKPEDRWPIMRNLIGHMEDASDHNLPLMYWYALEPLADVDPARALHLANHAEIPLIQEFTARKIAMKGTAEALGIIVDRLKDMDDAKKQLAFLRGTNEGLKGRRQAPMPTIWPEVFAKLSASNEKAVRDQAFALAVTFGDQKAFDVLRDTLVNKVDVATKKNALAALLNARDKHLPPFLHGLIDEAGLRNDALKGLAVYDDPKTPGVILGKYTTFSTEDKRAALNTLAARPVYGKALLDAVAAKKVPAADVSADIVRQLRNLGEAELDKQIAAVWGSVRSSPAEKLAMMKQYKGLVMKPSPAVDLSLGRAMFAKTCASCHKLYGVGGDVGPDITGANRANLDYLLENVIDPSAVIPKEYAATVIATKDGRTITGIVKSENQRALTIATQNETLILPRDEIDAIKPSVTSLMPEDQLKQMSEPEIRALFSYLMTPSQVPMLATAENAKDLFNGKDLTGWDGDAKLWKVENGEIVGTSPGIQKNEFLKSHMVAENFRLILKVKLVPNKENSGVQFRSEVLPNGDVKGYQADIGAGWWGKLYEEHGRELLWKKPGEQHVNRDGWNVYEIVAQGSKIRTYLNGKSCVDLDDPPGARRGIFAFQIHSGGPMEVRFKDLKLEVLK
jgi:putative membrane-bound dehydrogenase-like protein